MKNEIKELRKRLDNLRRLNMFNISLVNIFLKEPMAKTTKRYKMALDIYKQDVFTDDQKEELMFTAFGIEKK
jgi:hypothetical protein